MAAAGRLPVRTLQTTPEQLYAALSPQELAAKLHGIQSLTDAALAHLDLEGLLDEVLSRLRALLSADTASVLLCDDSDNLLVRATQGFADGPHPTIAIPVGQGLAGEVAARRTAVIVDDVSRVHTLNPALRSLASMIVAPMLAEGQLVGVVHVGTFAPREFAESDLHFLQVAADRLAVAVDRARQHERSLAEAAGRTRAEEDQRRSEERFGLLIESVADYAIFMLDPAGRITSWNRGAERIKGYTETEIVGRHFSVFYPPEAVAQGRPAEALATAEREGRYADEGWRVRRDGSRFWASVVITAMRDAAGRLNGFAKITRDLTERKRADESLRASEGRLAAIIDSAMDAVVTTDEDQRIVVFNRAAEKLFGWSAEEVLGTPLDRLLPEQYRSIHAHHMRDFALTGSTTRTMNPHASTVSALRSDGTEFPVEASISQVLVGEKRLLTAMVRDVTERVRAEENLRTAKEAAERANLAKSQFLAVMSHELRTPLSAVVGYADLMDQELVGPVTQPQRDFLYRIQRNARHLRGLIDEILTYARTEAGTEHIRPETLDLRALVHEVVEMFEAEASASGVALRVELGERPATITSDPGKVRQILTNLVGNAFKFTAAGEVRVAVASVSDELEVRVTDTGPGIEQDQLERIFEPFVQVDSGLTRLKGGTGLGLTVSRRLARLLGGDVTVESVPGHGSTFTLTLPARWSPSAAVAHAE